MTKSKNKAKENPQNLFVFFKTVMSGDVQFENKTQLIELMKDKFRIANSQIVLDWMIDNKFVSIESGKIELLFESVEFKICKSIVKGSESFRVNTRQSQSLKRKQKEIKPKVEIEEIIAMSNTAIIVFKILFIKYHHLVFINSHMD